MKQAEAFDRYRRLQSYVGWTDQDAAQVRLIGPVLKPHLSAIVRDLLGEVQRHPETHRVVGDSGQQVARLQGTLEQWLGQLFGGRYDEDFVWQRCHAGWRHVEVGLDPAFAAAALARMRSALAAALQRHWTGEPGGLVSAVVSLNKLLDLDLAMVQDSYQAELFARLEQRSEATFRNLVEAAECMIVILRPDHAIAYLSPHGEQLTGYAAEQVVGADYLKVFVPEAFHGKVADRLGQALAGTPARGFECPVRCRDGSQRWMIWNAQRLSEYRGSAAVLSVGQDITEFKSAQDRSLQSERLAIIGQMVTVLAHETRNAFQISQAHLEELALELEDRPQVLERVRQIKKAQGTIQHLYEDIRRYAAPISLDYEPCHLGELVEEAWAYLAVSRQGRQARLTIEPQSLDPYCELDRMRAEQVFRNLLENSLSACQDPVRITVGYADAQLDDRPAMRIWVRDNGPGLNAEQRERIFEPFYTTKTHGTGLGMAIVRRIVEAHGGLVSAGNAAGGGAEIVLTMPRWTEAAACHDQQSQKRRSANQPQPSYLI